MQIIRLTPPGRGAVASFLLCGENAVEAFMPHWHGTLPGSPPRFGRLQLNDTGLCEEAVVYCTDEGIEIHTHGGEQVAAAVESLFQQHGAVRKTWQEHVKCPILQRIPFAPTERTAQILLDQYNGAYSRAMSAVECLTDPEERTRRLARLAELSGLWKHLVEPFRVVLAGAGNAGKSSLLNAVLGFQRSIVHHQPGTTRDVLSGQTALAGFPVTFYDTAGFREADNDLERQGIGRSQQSLNEADLVVWVIDVTAAAHQQPLCPGHTNVLVCYNKIDLADIPVSRQPAVGVSALTGEGIDSLLDAVLRRLVPYPPEPGEAVYPA